MKGSPPRPVSTMTSTDDKPPISLAAVRAEGERNFTEERANILKELEEIEVAADQLASITQRLLFLDWATYKAVAMLDSRDLEHDPRAVVELIKLIVK